MTFLDELAAPTPAPGGGSAAAYAGAMAASLLMMYTGLTMTRKSYVAVHDEMQRVHDEAARLKESLGAAVEQDARAFAAVMEASKLPKESQARDEALQPAIKNAAAIPMQVAEQSARVLKLARSVMNKGLKSAQSDMMVATFLAQAAIKGALLNVRVNLETITDAKFTAEHRARVKKVEAVL